jgi:hypothetical protein
MTCTEMQETMCIEDPIGGSRLKTASGRLAISTRAIVGPVLGSGRLCAGNERRIGEHVSCECARRRTTACGFHSGGGHVGPRSHKKAAGRFSCHRTSAAISPPRAARLARHEVFRVRSIATVKISSRPCRRGSGSSKVDQRPIVNPGRGEGISSIPLAVELHGRWHVMTPSIELRDGVCL